MNFEEPIRYLNKLTKRNFDWTKECHQRFLRARYKEGHTLEEIKKVIEWKVENWLNTPREKYLRPSTLFRPANFGNYYQEMIYSKKNANKIQGFKELK